MTLNQAIGIIRKEAPETEATFRAILDNRYSTPVRDWALYDLMKKFNLEKKVVRDRYYRHLKKLIAIFRA